MPNITYYAKDNRGKIESRLTLPTAYMLGIQLKLGPAKYHILDCETHKALCKTKPLKGKIQEAQSDLDVSLDAGNICYKCWNGSWHWQHLIDNLPHRWFNS